MGKPNAPGRPLRSAYDRILLCPCWARLRKSCIWVPQMTQISLSVKMLSELHLTSGRHEITNLALIASINKCDKSTGLGRDHENEKS